MANTIRTRLLIRARPLELGKLLSTYTLPDGPGLRNHLLKLERIHPLSGRTEERLEHWDCSGDTYDGESDLSRLGEGELVLKFSTAWTFPKRAIETLGRLEAALEIEGAYVEEFVESCARFRLETAAPGSTRALRFYDARTHYKDHQRPTRQDPVTGSVLREVYGEGALQEWTGALTNTTQAS